MPLHAQRKGKAGEVEFCKWLMRNLSIDVERNYNQANGHSSDVITDDFIFEVKRREVIDLDSWWLQVAIAKKRHPNLDLIPIVAFRQNRKKWGFAIPANLIPGMDLGYLVVNERVFIQFAGIIVRGNVLSK